MATYGEWQPWLDAVTEILETDYGLETGFAGRVALFLAYCMASGLSPRITSGWRDPKRQKAMRDAWDRGERGGLRARPAADSLHCRNSWLGAPAAKAVDIATIADDRAAAIARALGIGVGVDFRDPDPGHYFDKGTR